MLRDKAQPTRTRFVLEGGFQRPHPLPSPPFTTAHLPPRESLAALTSSSQCRLSNKQSQQRQNAGGLAAPSHCPAGRARILLLF